MFKKLWLLGMVLGTAVSTWAQANKLNLYIWSEYIDPEIVKDFEKKFDCKVTIDVFEDESAMLAKIQGGGAGLYDVVVPPEQVIGTMVSLKLLAPLRHQNIPNLKNLEERFYNPVYDPGNRYTAAYQWGTMGIYVRQPKDKPVAETWGILFDPKQQAGSFVLIDSHRDSIGAALKYLGYSLNSTDPKQLKQARDLLLNAKKRSLGFESGVGGKNKVLAKGATAAIVYNGDAARGTKEDKDTYFFVPKEGSEIWVDSMVVLAKAPHRDLAEKFINFILDAEVGAKLSNFNQYATPNKAAKPLITPEDLKNTAIYPTPEILAKLEFLKDPGRQAKLYDEIWTQVKAK